MFEQPATFVKTHTVRLECDSPLIHTRSLARQALLHDWLGQFFDPLKFQGTFRGLSGDNSVARILALTWEMEFLSPLEIALSCVDAVKYLLLNVIVGQQYLFLGRFHLLIFNLGTGDGVPQRG